MNVRTFLTSLKNIVNRISCKIKRPVPIGLTEFNNLVQLIIDTYNPPMTNRDVRFVIAAHLQRLEPREGARRSPESYWLEVRRAAATQIGGAVLYQLKQEQAAEFAAQKAAEEQKQLEAPTNGSASNDKPVSN